MSKKPPDKKYFMNELKPTARYMKSGLHRRGNRYFLIRPNKECIIKVLITDRSGKSIGRNDYSSGWFRMAREWCRTCKGTGLRSRKRFGR